MSYTGECSGGDGASGAGDGHDRRRQGRAGQLLFQIVGTVDLRENFTIIHLMIGFAVAVFVGNVIYDRIKYPQNQYGGITPGLSLILVGL